MLNNIEPIDTLRGLARTNAKTYITKSDRPSSEDAMLADGWIIEKRNKASTRFKKTKSHGVLLEDRVWYLFYRMGFSHLSLKGGGYLKIDPKDVNSPITKIDLNPEN